MKRLLAACLLALALLLGSTVPASAQTLYGVTGAGGASSSLYTIDLTTGAATLVGPTGFSHVTGLAFDPTTGVLYGHISALFGSTPLTQLITINPLTGVGTLVGHSGLQSPDMSFRADGTLFAWGEETDFNPFFDRLYTVDVGTGAATLVGTSSTASFRTGMAFATDGTLFLKSNLALFTLNPADGSSTSVGTITGVSTLHNALAFDSATNGYSIRREDGVSFLVAVDTVNLTAFEIGDMGVSDMSALAFDVAPIPEPGTLVLAGLALGTVAVTARRRLWRRRRKS
ncbi:MAG TPA: hypothetical protein PKD86_00455 [Gemmatales bacterium]|nr:hypothetical protein [Gemmatales bacterium]HMP57794.1 hypothetical protein [Gemmatales bacterium]